MKTSVEIVVTTRSMTLLKWSSVIPIVIVSLGPKFSHSKACGGTTSVWRNNHQLKKHPVAAERIARPALRVLENLPTRKIRIAATSGVKSMIQGAVWVLIKTSAC